MIRTGTTRFWDMYWHPEATARAVADAGMRATIGAPALRPRRRRRGDAGDGAAQPRRASPSSGPAIDPGARPALDLHGQRRLAALDRRARRAERDLPVHIHLSETEREVEDCLAAHGVRPAAYLDRLGLLSERTVLAHGVWLDPEELELVAARGCTVVTNPVANMKLAVGGVFPYPAARAAGVAVGLGTDGAGSNDSLDLLADLKVFALAQKHAAADPTAIAAAEAWAIATGARAPLLGAASPARVGAAGRLPPAPPATPPSWGSASSPPTSSTPPPASVVDTTVVGGQVLMRGGELPGLAEIVARAAERRAPARPLSRARNDMK